jgi:hypothetical protein
MFQENLLSPAAGYKYQRLRVFFDHTDNPIIKITSCHFLPIKPGSDGRGM